MLEVGFFATGHGGNHGGQGGGHGSGGGGGRASAGGGGGCGELFDEGLDAGAQASDGGFAAHDRGEAVFKDERGTEILDLQEPLGGLLQGQLGDEADDLAGDGLNSVAGGFALDEGEDAVDGSLFEVGQVHGDLGEFADEEAGGFDVAQAAGGETDGFGDLAGDVDVGCIEEDVVGDKGLARADDGGAGGGMDAGLAEVGAAGGVGDDFVAQALEL